MIAYEREHDCTQGTTENVFDVVFASLYCMFCIARDEPLCFIFLDCNEHRVGVTDNETTCY